MSHDQLPALLRHRIFTFSGSTKKFALIGASAIDVDQRPWVTSSGRASRAAPSVSSFFTAINRSFGARKAQPRRGGLATAAAEIGHRKNGVEFERCQTERISFDSGVLDAHTKPRRYSYRRCAWHGCGRMGHPGTQSFFTPRHHTEKQSRHAMGCPD